jgi:hypothetical protein
MPRPLLLGVALGTFVASAASAAEFDWNAPSGCPDRDALRWRIEEALGTTLAKAAPLKFSASVQEKSTKRWVVTLDVASDSNQTAVQHRELQASSCDELAQAASVAVALALGADVTEPKEPRPEVPSAGDSEKTTKPVWTAPVEARLSRAATPRKETESTKSAWWAAELGPVLDMGSLPGPALGIEVAGLVGQGPAAIKLGGLALPNRSGEVVDNRGGTFTLFAASLMACGNSLHSFLNLRLCAGSEFGRLSGRGNNVTQTWTGSSGWLAPRIDLAVSWPLLDESLRLAGLSTVALPLIRKEFSVQGLGLVHQPGAVTGRLGAGLELLW